VNFNRRQADKFFGKMQKNQKNAKIIKQNPYSRHIYHEKTPVGQGKELRGAEQGSTSSR
jgi:hypothetical protein